MNSLVEVMNRLSGSALLVLLNVAWQCGVVFLVAFAAIRLFRPRSPLTRHLVWLVALVGMASCPLLTVTGLAGNLQLVQVPLAFDSARDATMHASQQPVAANNVAAHVAVTPIGPSAGADARPHETAHTDAGSGPPGAEAARPHDEDPGHYASTDPLGRGVRAVAPLAGPTQSAQAQRPGWPAVVVAAWTVGVLALLVRLLVAQLAVWRLVRRSTPARGASLRRAFDSARAMVGVKRDVALRVSDELAVPVAAGLFRPCVLFPEQLAEQLPEADLEAIAVHELTHVRRMDPAIMLLERLAQAVLFFHPAVWLARRQLSAAREELCDEAVVRATSKPVAYAKCLTSLFEQVRVLSHCRIASVGVAHYRSKLFKRVETLLSGRMLLLRRLPRSLKAAVIGAACAALVLIGGTSFVPTQAIDAAEPDSTTTTAAAPAERHRWVRAGELSGAEVRALVLCRSRPDVLYAATPNGLYRTTDGAERWQPCAGHGMSGSRIAANDVAVDPKDPRIVYVTSGWLHKSTDGGASWKVLPVDGGGGAVALIEADPTSPGTIYVADRDRGVFKSTDGGATWRQGAGLKKEDLEFDRFEMDPRAPQALFGVAGGSVYVTTDGADTWRPVKLPFESWQLRGIRAGGKSNDILYAGTTEDVYYYSDDGGETWESFYSAEQDPEGEQTDTIKELRRCFLYGLANAGRQSRWTGGPIVPHPSEPDVVYRVAMELSSVLKTEDFGQTWTVMNTGFSSFETRGVACDNETPGLVYVAGRSGLYKSTDGAKTWKQIMTQGWSGPPVTVHPLDPQTLLVGTGDDKAIISTDGGETWDQIDDTRGAKIEAFVFDPQDADTFYILTRARILKTTDHGDTWDPTDGSIELSRRTGDWPGTTQTSADIIYAIAERKRLLRSTDVGKTWDEVMALGKDEENWIGFVEVHPTDPKTAIAGVWNGPLHLTHDAGKSWQTVETPGSIDDMRPCCVGFDPKDPNVFYVGSDSRANIMRTRDGGKTFETLSDGLPDSNIIQIVVSPADGAVYAGTDGAGLYRLETGKPASEEQQ